MYMVSMRTYLFSARGFGHPVSLKPHFGHPVMKILAKTLDRVISESCLRGCWLHGTVIRGGGGSSSREGPFQIVSGLSL